MKKVSGLGKGFLRVYALPTRLGGSRPQVAVLGFIPIT